MHRTLSCVAGCRLVMVAVGLALGWGCATGDPYFMDTKTRANVYVAPGTTSIRKVAIMPFRAASDLTGSTISDFFVTEILRGRRYTLVERSQMSKVLSESELALAGLSESKAVEVGSMLGADGVIVGTVDEYSTVAVRGHPYPVVGISVRLIDVRSGRVMWSADLARRADDKETILSTHARNVVHEMVAGLYQNWGRQKIAAPVASASGPEERGSPRSPALAPDAPIRRKPPGEPPPVIREVTLSDMGMREVRVVWVRPSRKVDKVRIERGVTSRGPFKLVAEVEAKQEKFTDTGEQGGLLEDGRIYYYRLTAVEEGGTCSEPSEIFESMTAPPPSPPEEVEVSTPRGRMVRLTWGSTFKPGDGLYRIERARAGDDPTFSVVAKVSENVFEDGTNPESPLEDDATYLYRITTVTRAGTESDPSDFVLATTRPRPATIRGLAVEPGGLRSVRISWDRHPEKNVIRYEVYRRNAAKGWDQVGATEDAESTHWVDRGSDGAPLLDDQEYAYTVVAVNEAHAKSKAPPPVTARTRPPPPIPEGLEVESGFPRTMPVFWTLSPDDAVQGYRLERAEAGGAFSALADIQGREQVSFLDGTQGTPLADGAAYRYRVAAINRVGVSSAWSPGVEGVTKAAPLAPGGLWASTNQAGRIELGWDPNPEADIAGYELSWAEHGEGPFAEAGTVPGTGARLELADPGLVRYLRVRARDRTDLVGAWSVPVSGCTKPRPQPPERVQVQYGSGQVRLLWPAVPQSDVQGYRVWIQRAKEWALLLETPETGVDLDFSQVGEGAVLAVSAMDVDGLESPRSGVADVGEPAPPIPVPADASRDGLREVTVRWNPPRDNAVTYLVETAPGPDGPWVAGGEARAAAGSFVHRGAEGQALSDATDYVYRLKAVAGNGRVSEPSLAVRGRTAPPPAPPARLEAAATKGRAVLLTWTPSSGAEVVRYLVERRGAADPDFAEVGQVPETSYFEGGSPDSPLADASSYAYRIRAVNRVGATGPASEPVQVTTRPPPAAVDELLAESHGVRCVPLSWKPSPEEDVIRYEIFRMDSRREEWARIHVAEGRRTRAWLDGGADPGNLNDETTYWYRLVAVNEVEAASEPSVAVEAVTRPPPAMIEGLRVASAMPRSALLDWSASSDDKVVAYEIVRARAMPDEFVPLQRIAGRDVTTYLDRGEARPRDALGQLEDHGLYRYRIRAINTAGAASPWNEPVEATTKPLPVPPGGLQASTNLAARIELTWEPNPESDIATYEVTWSDRSDGRYREVAELKTAGPATGAGLDPSERRFLRVRALDEDGLVGPWAAPVQGRAKPLPNAPAGLHLEDSGGVPSLTWSPVPQPDIATYRIYRKAFLGWKVVGETSKTAYRLNLETLGKQATLAVTAVDADTQESARSVSIEVTP